MYNMLNNQDQQFFPHFELPNIEFLSDTLELYSMNPKTITHSSEMIRKRT